MSGFNAPRLDRQHSLPRILALVAALMLLPTVAAAATADDVNAGAVLRSVPVGIPSASCPTVGPSLALVQTSKLNVTPAVLAQQPVLLVTSCLSTKVSLSSVLYFLSPADGSVITKLTTVKAGKAYAPGSGWAGLVLAPDQGLLYGCGTNGELYSIDYSVFTSTVDGTLTAVPRPSALTSCTGLAWDASNKTLYASTATTIYHFNLAGASQTPATLAPPAGCSVSGLTVTGGVLEIACNASTSVRRVGKAAGGALADHTSVAFQGGALADLECDPVSFAGFNVDALWSKVVSTNLMQAFRVPGGTCGLPPAATVFAPAACPDPLAGVVDPYRQDIGTVLGVPRDTDEDGLWDCWEDPTRWADGRPGIDFDGNGTRDAVLCTGTECASPTVKDIFVEIDYMEGTSTHLAHQPDPVAVANVQAAFAAAPVDAPVGIRLHVLVDEAIPHTDYTALVPCTGAALSGDTDFDTLRDTKFGTATERASGDPNTLFAKRFGFRYMVFAHSLTGTGASGCAELPGDDSVIALAGFGPTDPTDPYYQRGTTDEQAGTMMHELGHNLGLRHGGGDNLNCKPNYLSVMNYSRQMPDFLANRPLDYSRGLQPTLHESGVVESAGIGDIALFPQINGNKTAFSASNSLSMQYAKLGTFCDSGNGQCTDYGQAVDWNNDGTISNSALVTDVNKYLKAGCDGSGTDLAGYDDWDSLQYNARASLDFGTGARAATTQEQGDKSFEQSQASFDGIDTDQDGTLDAFGCGSTSVRCAIDIKPGTKPKVLRKGSESNVQVAILSSASFDAPDQVLRNTLTLNDVAVKFNTQQNQGTCSAVSITPGRLDLVCQFPASALPIGGNYAILEGTAYTSAACVTEGCATTRIRARDFITVQK